MLELFLIQILRFIQHFSKTFEMTDNDGSYFLVLPGRTSAFDLLCCITWTMACSCTTKNLLISVLACHWWSKPVRITRWLPSTYFSGTSLLLAFSNYLCGITSLALLRLLGTFSTSQNLIFLSFPSPQITLLSLEALLHSIHSIHCKQGVHGLYQLF